MYNDPNYIALDSINYQFVNQIHSNADLHYLLNSSGTITQSQFVYTVKQLGFKDTTAFRDFQNKQIPLQQYLHAKYFSGDTIITFSALGYSVHPNLSPCTAQFTLCMHQASAIYTFRVIDCTGIAVGFGTLSMGIGGLVFQIGCGATAIYYLNQDKDDCRSNYQACSGH